MHHASRASWKPHGELGSDLFIFPSDPASATTKKLNDNNNNISFTTEM